MKTAIIIAIVVLCLTGWVYFFKFIRLIQLCRDIFQGWRRRKTETAQHDEEVVNQNGRRLPKAD